MVKPIRDTVLFLAFLLLLCVDGWGCAAAPEPPKRFSIDPAFPEAERATIRAAVAAWCDSEAESCPEETERDTWARFELVDHIESRGTCSKTPGCVVAGRNTGDGRILIARDRLEADDLLMLWTVVAHEWGHYCIDGHPVSGGLMTDVHRSDVGALDIDDAAVDAWRQGCP